MLKSRNIFFALTLFWDFKNNIQKVGTKQTFIKVSTLLSILVKSQIF